MDVFWSFPRFLTISLVFLLTQLQSQAQTDYFWVGGTGNWSDFDNHWATGSGGSTMHTEAPGTDDDVFFDVNSFSTLSQVITLDGFAFCLDMDWTGVTNFPTIFGDGNDIFIYGSLTLASDMTSDLNNVQFWSTNTGNTITTVGTTLGSNSNITFNGIGGEWTLQDNLEVFKVFLTAGTFNTNNNNVNAANRFETNGSDAKALNLGSSEITTQTWFVSGTNNTINSGTSKIEVSSFFFGDLNSDGPFTYYDLQFTDIGFGTIKLKNTSTFNQITIPNDISLELESGSVFTINDLVADGEKHKPINIYSNNSGSEATFNKTTGSITVSYLTLKDVHATGTATFTANNTVNNGNTTGWNINAAIGQDYFWVGNGGNWTDFSNHWATTTGGISMHSDYPGSLDNVFFDANSFSTASEIVTVDLSTNCFNMDWSGVTNSPSFTSEFSVTLEVLGDLTFTDEVNKTIPNIILKGSGNHTLTYADNGSIFNFRFSGTGTYTLQDPVAAFRIFFNDGIINLNNQPVNARLEILGGVTLNMGSSEIISDNILDLLHLTGQ